MFYRICLFFICLYSFNPIFCAVIQTKHDKMYTLTLEHPQSSNWQDISLPEMNLLLDSLDSAFAETNFRGYVIEFLDDPMQGPYIEFTVSGGRREKGKPLSGVPVAGHSRTICPFCSSVNQGVNIPEYGCRLIQSLSGRPLLIPTIDPIPVHWFDADRQTQCNLLQAAKQVLKSLQGNYTLELHGGIPGGQTVWHLHLRFNSRHH